MLLLSGALAAQSLDVSKLELVNSKADAVSYQGKKAIRLTQADQKANQDLDMSIAILKGVKFRNGEVELDLAGEPGASAAAAARGFVGVAFRVQEARRFECIYLRPTNGRADDQVRRNHSIQYESIPDFPWFRLRKESPEQYESYVDLQPAVWTHYRLSVKDTKARLFVNGATQPSLVVNDLKLGASEGGVALWIGPGTLAHFSGLVIRGE